jgi:hypothetical protein
VDCCAKRKSDVACLERKLKLQLLVYIIDIIDAWFDIFVKTSGLGGCVGLDYLPRNS